MEDYIQVLRQELNAEDGTFLLKLRPQLDWDESAFSRLVRAMHRCCEECASSETVERWLANGFWYIPRFTRDWVSHPSFPRTRSNEYYEMAFQLLDDLAYWFFFGASPYNDATGFELAMSRLEGEVDSESGGAVAGSLAEEGA